MHRRTAVQVVEIVEAMMPNLVGALGELLCFSISISDYDERVHAHPDVWTKSSVFPSCLFVALDSCSHFRRALNCHEIHSAAGGLLGVLQRADAHPKRWVRFLQRFEFD